MTNRLKAIFSFVAGYLNNTNMFNLRSCKDGFIYYSDNVNGLDVSLFYCDLTKSISLEISQTTRHNNAYELSVTNTKRFNFSLSNKVKAHIINAFIKARFIELGIIENEKK